MPPVSRSATLTRMNANCQVIWNRAYKVGDVARACAVRLANDDPSSYVMAGHTGNWNADGVVATSSIFAMKTDVAGNQLWLHRYGHGPLKHYSTKIEMKKCLVGASAAGGYILCGTLLYGGEPYTADKGFLLRINDNGNMMWMKYYSMGDVSPSVTAFKDVEPLPNGNFVVTGHTLSPAALSNYQTETILFTVDGSGNPVAGLRYPTVSIDTTGTEHREVNSGESLRVLPNGIAVVGSVVQESIDNRGTELFTVDNSGIPVWYRFISNVDPGGTEVANGTLRHDDEGTLTFVAKDAATAIVQFDAGGNYLAGMKYGGYFSGNTGTSLYAEADGGFTFVGASEVFPLPGSIFVNNMDYRVGKTAAGTLSTGCDEDPLTLNVTNRDILAQDIAANVEIVQDFTSDVATVDPLNWTSDNLCVGCSGLPVVVVSVDVVICPDCPDIVIIDWEPVGPGVVGSVEIRRDGILIGQVDGNTFTDPSPTGVHRYELTFNPTDATDIPVYKTITVDATEQLPLSLVTDLILVQEQGDLTESLCLESNLSELGRSPKVIRGDDQVLSHLIGDFGSDRPEFNRVAWVLLGESPHQQPLSQISNELLSQFLTVGGSLYIEGADVGSSISDELASLAGVTSIDPGSETGQVAALGGLDSEVGLDLSDLSGEYGGSGQHVDSLMPVGDGSGAIFRNLSSDNQLTAVYHNSLMVGGIHRVITSSTLLSRYEGDTMTLVDRLSSALGDVVFGDPPQFIRGDGNIDGSVDIGDAIFGLNYLFGGLESLCGDALDTNDDGNIDIGDPIAILGLLFSGATPPPAPFPGCGQDPTSDSLDCEFGPASCP